MDVSEETAKFFVDQCIGTHSGHMAAIPNNPVLFGLLKAHGVESYNTDCMAKFLEKVAAHLRNETPF